MKHVIRLLIALIIGLVAALLNWMWMSRERTYPEYVYVAEAISAGERIDKAKLKPVQVKGESALLSRVLVPWSQKELWYDRYASRDYSEGQPLFQRDMEESSIAREWDTLGPFMLVGVGNEATAAFSKQAGNLINVSGNILTLAIDDSQKDEKNLLYRYLAAMRGEYYFNETAAERNLLKIIGVEPRISGTARLPELDAEEAADDLSAATRPGDNAVAGFAGQRLIFVSLENVPNAPAWLRIGEEIYFMVPPGKQKLLARSAEAGPVPGEPETVPDPQKNPDENGNEDDPENGN